MDYATQYGIPKVLLNSFVAKQLTSILTSKMVTVTSIYENRAGAFPLQDTAPITGAPRPDASIANVQEPVLQYVNDWDAKLFQQGASGSLVDLVNERMSDLHGTTGERYGR